MRRAALGGIAVAGLIAGHCLSYRFFGDTGAHVHHQSAHSHLPYLFAVIAGLVAAALGAVVDHRLGRRGTRLVSTTLVLLGTQLVGFVALSIVDRVMGMPGTGIGSRAFWVGLLVQLVVAFLGAIVLGALRGTIEVIDRVLRAELPPIETAEVDLGHLSLTVAIPSLAMATGGPTFRGPPLHRRFNGS